MAAPLFAAPPPQLQASKVSFGIATAAGCGFIMIRAPGVMSRTMQPVGRRSLRDQSMVGEDSTMGCQLLTRSGAFGFDT